MDETPSRAVDHLGFIRRTLGELAEYERFTFEPVQNTNDTHRAAFLRFDLRDEALWVEDDGGRGQKHGLSSEGGRPERFDASTPRETIGNHRDMSGRGADYEGGQQCAKS